MRGATNRYDAATELRLRRYGATSTIEYLDCCRSDVSVLQESFLYRKGMHQVSIKWSLEVLEQYNLILKVDFH